MIVPVQPNRCHYRTFCQFIVNEKTGQKCLKPHRHSSQNKYKEYCKQHAIIAGKEEAYMRRITA